MTGFTLQSLSIGENDSNPEIKSEMTLSRRNWIPIRLPESWLALYPFCDLFIRLIIKLHNKTGCDLIN